MTGDNHCKFGKSAGGIQGVRKQIKHDLDELPHHRGVVATSAGVMPPLCKPETIKEVAELVRDYPVSNIMKV